MTTSPRSHCAHNSSCHHRSALGEQPSKKAIIGDTSSRQLPTKLNASKAKGSVRRICYGLCSNRLWVLPIILIHWVLCSLSYTQIEPVAFIEPVVAPIMVDDAIALKMEEGSARAAIASLQSPSVSQPIYASADIARLAARNASLAILMRGDLQADRTGIFRPSKRQQATLDLRSKVQEYRIARQTQIVASQALELHFGLAAIAALEPIQRDVLALIATRSQQQQRAIERGIPVLDPTALDRLATTTYDTQLQSQGKSSELRSQLALLVEPSIACHYAPESLSPPRPAEIDHCKMTEWAMSQRCDLVGLIYLREHLDMDTLDVARWMSDVLSGSAALSAGLPLRPLAVLGIVSSKEKEARQAELSERLKMLDEAIKSLRAKIASEVDIALSHQATAYERYTNSQRQLELWNLRVAQLRKYGDEVKPQLAEEMEAELQVLQVQSELVQRQADWHQAVVELALAVGCVP